MKLIEIIHSIKTENKHGLIKIDNWRWPDVDHLISMGFELKNEYYMNTPREPSIKIYKKKVTEPDNKKVAYYYIEEKNKTQKRFKTFNDVIEYFDHYEQPDLDKNT